MSDLTAVVLATVERETGMPGVTTEMTIDDLGLDSLDLISLTVCIAHHTGREVPDDKLASLETVGDIVRALDAA